MRMKRREWMLYGKKYKYGIVVGFFIASEFRISGNGVLPISLNYCFYSDTEIKPNLVALVNITITALVKIFYTPNLIPDGRPLI
jgi:hypothetical protein